METNFFDQSKRKFLWMSAAAFASLNFINRGNAQAKETSNSLEARLEAKIAEHDLQIERLKAVTAIQNLHGAL